MDAVNASDLIALVEKLNKVTAMNIEESRITGLLSVDLHEFIFNIARDNQKFSISRNEYFCFFSHKHIPPKLQRLWTIERW